MLTIIKIRAKITALYYKTLIKLHWQAMNTGFAAGHHAATTTKNLIRAYDAAITNILTPKGPTSNR